MRPLLLELSGLHSFREKRRVDFALLLRDNLFGIFGPTGSGKSTILDAITLALFGKIDRTKGKEVASAINMRSDRCTVALTFEVNDGDLRTRYRVERLYKQQKSGLQREARLVAFDVDGSERVIAEKAQNVQAALGDILGMSDDDFLRAVVLPQGKFAEFLSLKAADRGKMLQRLFGLEEFGGHLRSRLKTLTDDLKLGRANLAATLQQLSPYDDDALVLRRTVYEETAAELARRELEVEEAQKRLTAAENLFALIAERNDLRAHAEDWSAGDERLALLTATIGRADRALSVAPTVERAADAERSFELAVRAYEENREHKEGIERRIADLSRARARAEAMMREDGGDEGRGEIPALRNEIALLREIAKEMEQRATAEERLRRREDSIRVATATLDRLKKEDALATARILARESEVEQANGEVAELGTQLERAQEKDRLLTSLCDGLREREAILARIEADEASEQEFAQAFDRAEKEIEEADAERLRLIEEDRKRRIDDALAEAVELLNDGEPCPLCGSIHHPAPHRVGGEASGSLEEAIAAIGHGRQEAERRARETHGALAALRRTVEDHRARAADIERRIEALRGSHSSLEEIILPESSTAAATRLAKVRQVEEELRRNLATARERIATVQRDLDLLRSDQRNASLETGRLHGRIESDENERKREKIELDEIVERLDATVEHFRSIAGGALGDVVGSDDLTPHEAIATRESKLRDLEAFCRTAIAEYDAANEELVAARATYEAVRTHREQSEKLLLSTTEERARALAETGFESIEDYDRAILTRHELEGLRAEARDLDERLRSGRQRLATLDEMIGDRKLEEQELNALREAHAERRAACNVAGETHGAARAMLEECKRKNAEWKEVVARNAETEQRALAAEQLSTYLRGDAFVNYLADERLDEVCRAASLQLRDVSRGRLAIRSDAEQGFRVIDYGNGGVERSTSSLSGGETFLVSLALALALSDSIRLGKGPIEFFVLDEGFGTLDAELLEVAMDSLERLRLGHRAVGVITHVPAVQERIANRLIVTPANEDEGSKVEIEIA